MRNCYAPSWQLCNDGTNQSSMPEPGLATSPEEGQHLLYLEETSCSTLRGAWFLLIGCIMQRLKRRIQTSVPCQISMRRALLIGLGPWTTVKDESTHAVIPAATLLLVSRLMKWLWANHLPIVQWSRLPNKLEKRTWPSKNVLPPSRIRRWLTGPYWAVPTWEDRTWALFLKVRRLPSVSGGLPSKLRMESQIL